MLIGSNALLFQQPRITSGASYLCGAGSWLSAASPQRSSRPRKTPLATRPQSLDGEKVGACGLVTRMFGKFGDYRTHLMGGAVAKRFAGRAVTPSPSFHPGGDGPTRPRKLKLQQVTNARSDNRSPQFVHKYS